MSHDYPACAIFRGGKCTCDEAGQKDQKSRLGAPASTDGWEKTSFLRNSTNGVNGTQPVAWRCDEEMTGAGRCGQQCRACCERTSDLPLGLPREHTAAADCWCHPEAHYKDPDTGATVYVHRGQQ